MIKKLLKNKQLSLLTSISIITIIISVLLPAFFKKNTILEINNHINELISNIKQNKISHLNVFLHTYFNNSIIITIVWFFGISIIGIPIILFIYVIKLIIYVLKIFFLFKNIKQLSILFILIYIIPSTFNIIFLFILTYYSCNYTIILFKYLFLKKDYSLKQITKKYIKIYLIFLILFLISNIIEIFLIPKFLYFLK